MNLSEGIMNFLRDIIGGKKKKYIDDLKQSDPEIRDAIEKMERNRDKVKDIVSKSQKDSGRRIGFK